MWFQVIHAFLGLLADKSELSICVPPSFLPLLFENNDFSTVEGYEGWMYLSVSYKVIL